MWLTDFGIPFVWIEASDAVGGTLRRVGNPVRNYLGVVAKDGPALVAAIEESLTHLTTKPRFGTPLRSVQAAPGGVRCSYGSSTHLHQAVILALGTRPRLLGLPNESELLGRGVEISVTRNLPRYRGKEVCVVGGGDAALEGSLLLAAASSYVHLIHRRTDFRGQARFVDAVRAHERIVIHETEVVAVHGESALDSVTLASGRNISVSGLFVRIGVEPITLDGLATDDSGYISVDDEFRASIPQVYACGDGAAPWHQSAAWAAGSAAAAARAVMDAQDWQAPGP